MVRVADRQRRALRVSPWPGHTTGGRCATALIVVVLAPSLAANLDTGNINVFIALTPWLAWLVSARWGGVAWAVGTALKFVPAPLLLFMPRASWRIGLAVLAVFAVLTLATWPETLRQLDIVLNYPRPLRIDYLILAWGIVPWLWLRDWPPRFTREWLPVRRAPKTSA